VAPFVHAKGESHQVDEDPAEMRVVDEPYGFEADFVDKVTSIHHDQKQLDATIPFQARRAIYELRTGVKIPKTAAQLELESRQTSGISMPVELQGTRQQAGSHAAKGDRGRKHQTTANRRRAD
jgi:hypothetical protein